MKITIASLDHFWLLNQAHYFLKKDFLQDYFSTRVRPNVEKIPPPKNHSCYPLHYSLRVMQRWPQWVGGNHFYLQLCRLFDHWLEPQFSRQSNLLVVLSGVGLNSFLRAKKEEITTVIECGSTHTDYQHAIVLDEFKRNGLGKPLFPEGYRNRVRKEFAVADYIQVPTRFVANTFLENGVPESKLLLAPYGTDLRLFHHRNKIDFAEPFRVICASGINLRKGARILVEAWRKLGWQDAELHWIGQITPQTKHLFQPSLSGLFLYPHLRQQDLSNLYRRCDVMTLPSFEEGFARVIIESAACGVPSILTPNTGAEDFFSEDRREGWLIPVNDVDALCDALKEAKADREKTFARGEKATERAQAFSWENYGAQVEKNYRRILSVGD